MEMIGVEELNETTNVRPLSIDIECSDSISSDTGEVLPDEDEMANEEFEQDKKHKLFVDIFKPFDAYQVISEVK
jgi:hypothetical protein